MELTGKEIKKVTRTVYNVNHPTAGPLVYIDVVDENDSLDSILRDADGFEVSDPILFEEVESFLFGD
jgi:DNA-directed RNA polymerase subunit L